jgi:EAL domain-containing protein (putative c-di-GMP-specific phosphodiesterase class I)
VAELEDRIFTMDRPEKAPAVTDWEHLRRQIAEDRQFIQHIEQQREIRRVKLQQAEQSLRRLRRIIDRMAEAAG